MKDMQIIDISQPIDSHTACFPGDVPFSKEVNVDFNSSQVINLTNLTMSPHIGTHIDSPAHIRGDLNNNHETVGLLPLQPFIGEVLVIDIAPHHEAITLQQIQNKLSHYTQLPERILFKTCHQSHYRLFEQKNAYFTVEIVDFLAKKGVILMGIDTPSVDNVDAKDLEAHHALVKAKMFWIENLDLTAATEGKYILIALPLRLTELEASPVRAVLLNSL